eukprot:m51a1_g8181 hypothetical protein (295) ;mRNA; f:127535-138076
MLGVDTTWRRHAVVEAGVIEVLAGALRAHEASPRVALRALAAVEDVSAPTAKASSCLNIIVMLRTKGDSIFDNIDDFRFVTHQKLVEVDISKSNSKTIIPVIHKHIKKVVLCDIPQPAEKCTLVFTVWNHSKIGLHTRLATAEIPVAAVVAGMCEDKDVPLRYHGKLAPSKPGAFATLRLECSCDATPSAEAMALQGKYSLEDLVEVFHCHVCGRGLPAQPSQTFAPGLAATTHLFSSGGNRYCWRCVVFRCSSCGRVEVDTLRAKQLKASGIRPTEPRAPTPCRECSVPVHLC